MSQSVCDFEPLCLSMSPFSISQTVHVLLFWACAESQSYLRQPQDKLFELRQTACSLLEVSASASQQEQAANPPLLPPAMSCCSFTSPSLIDKSLGTPRYQQPCRKPFLRIHKGDHALRRSISNDFEAVYLPENGTAGMVVVWGEMC